MSWRACFLAMLTLLALSAVLPIAAQPRSDRVERGIGWLERGDLRQALRAFEEAASLQPDDARARALCGWTRVLISLEPPLRPRSTRRPASTPASTPDTRPEAKADTKERERERQRALADLDRAVELDPRKPAVYAFRGQAQAMLGNPQRALDDLNRALARDPRSTEILRFRAALYEGALDSPLRALADYARCVELDPDSALAYNDRARVLTRLERFEEALADLRQALRIDPALPLTWCNRAATRLTMREPSSALPDAQRALELAPQSVRALHLGGVALIELGRPAEAERLLTRYIRARPDDAEGWRARARAWRELGRRDLAVEDDAESARLPPATSRTALPRPSI